MSKVPVMTTWTYQSVLAGLTIFAVKVWTPPLFERLKWCVHESLPAVNIGAVGAMTLTVTVAV